jgi:malate permease and related proteins
MLSSFPATIAGIFPNIILPVFIIIGIGFVVQRSLHLDVAGIGRLNLYVFSPALIYSSLSKSTISSDEIIKIAMFVALLAVANGVVAFGTCRACRFDRPTSSGYMLTTILMNAGNYGLPVTLLAFGQEGLQIAVIFFVAQAVMINPVAIYLASRSENGVKQAITSVFKIPLIYAAILAVIVLAGWVTLPTQIDQPITMLGQASIPILLVVLGMQLAQTSLREQLAGVGLATFSRLVLSIGMGVALVAVMQMGPLAGKVAILEGAMPSAVTSVIFAMEFKADSRFVTSVVLVSTLASMVTLSVLLAFIK